MMAVNVFKLLALFGVIQFSKADVDGKIIFVNKEAQSMLNQIMNYRSPRQAEYGLIRFEDDTSQDTNKPYRLVTFEDQSPIKLPNKPIKFNNQEDYNSPENSNDPTVENTPSQFVLQNEQNNDNQIENIPQKKRKKRRRRKPRVQQSQGYPPIPTYQGNNYSNNLGYSGFNYRPPRRSPTESTWSSLLNALTSVTVNDDYQCIPMLVCQAAARGLFGNSTLLQFTQLNSLLAAYGSISTSPIFVFGRAAILGMTAKNDPESCAPQYPLCPTDPQKLVYYLNNHRGGFFRFFMNPAIKQTQQAQYGPQQLQNVPNDILQQIVPQLHDSFGQYGLYQANPNTHNIEPHIPYLGQHTQQNYGLHPTPAFQPVGYYGHANKNQEYIPQQQVPHTVELKKRDLKSKFNFSSNFELDQNITKRSHNHKHSSKHSRKKHKRQRKHKRKGRNRKRKSHHHRTSSYEDEERRSHSKGEKGLEEKSNKFLTIDAKTFQIDPQRTLEGNFESPMVLDDVKVSRRFRRSAYPESWIQYENQMAPSGSSKVSTNAAGTSNPAVYFDEVVKATDYLAKMDDHHCMLLLICENAARGFLYFANSNTSAYYNSSMEVLRHMSTFGEAAIYGLDHRNVSDACHKRYPECLTDRDNLMNYMRNYKGGFFKYFRQPNIDGFYKNFKKEMSLSQTAQWGNNNANMMPQYNQMSYLNRNNNPYSQTRQNQGNMYPYYQQPSGNYGQFRSLPQNNVFNENSNMYPPPVKNQYPNFALPKYGSRLYNEDQVNYGNLFPSYRRSYFSYDDEKKEENKNVIQKRIQNFKPEFVEDINERPNVVNNNWKFPGNLNVDYPGDSKSRGGRNIKFPSEMKASVEISEEAQDFVFPGAQSNRQYNDFYNDLSSFDDNKLEVEDEFEIVYVIRGNGDPSRPEIVRLRPGEKIM